MADLLYNAALEYSKLNHVVYEILLGRKGRTYRLMLHFPPESFYHLAGLQHLTDITFPSKNKERIYKEIINKKITMDTIRKSVFFESYFIEERIVNLPFMESLLDSNSLTYLINQREYIKYTRIKADYLFEYCQENQEILYFFIVKEREHQCFDDECKGCSYFKKHKIDYTRGTSGSTVLSIRKIFNYKKPDQYVEIKYVNPSYKKRMEDEL